MAINSVNPSSEPIKFAPKADEPAKKDDNSAAAEAKKKREDDISAPVDTAVISSKNAGAQIAQSILSSIL